MYMSISCKATPALYPLLMQAALLGTAAQAADGLQTTRRINSY